MSVARHSTSSSMDSGAFTIGIICALPVECTAVLTILDEEYPQLPEDAYYGSRYQFGRIGVHDIVIGCLSSGKIGVAEAASIASKMRFSFPNIRVGLLCFRKSFGLTVAGSRVTRFLAFSRFV